MLWFVAALTIAVVRGDTNHGEAVAKRCIRYIDSNIHLQLNH